MLRPSLALSLIAALAACGHNDKSPAPKKSGTILTALFKAADAEKSPWRCAALDTPVVPDEDLGGWKAHAHSLTREGNELTIGVIADAGGDAGKTLAALGRLRGQLDDAKPDLVISLGGMGSDASQIAATLGTISDHAEWPLVALPGDLESAAAQSEAIETLRKRGARVLDGRLVRFIEAGGATLATIPGASARDRLVAGDDGCGWTADDIAKLVGELTTRKGLRVLVTAEAPRAMTGVSKRGAAGEATGELALVAAQPVDLAVHAPSGPVSAPSAAQSGTRDGAKVALTPGTADATTRLPDAHVASAGVLAIRGDRWSWKPLVDSSK
ncbi:MAG TPA: hypothetical protein VMZ53_01370 [Kofleriaceae bacterium]|nr:hypothetical protein [Kofleriaceae bacterium]